MLIPTIDPDTGDDVLEAEKGPDGEYVWTPTPEQYEAFRQRDADLAYMNAVRSADPRPAEVVIRGKPCTYRWTKNRHGTRRLEFVGGSGDYCRTTFWTADEHTHLHNPLTYGAAYEALHKASGVKATPVAGKEAL